MAVDRRGMTQGAYAGALPMWTPFAWLLPMGLRKKQKDFFVYHTNFLPLAAGATVTNTIAVEADSDFLITEVRAIVTDTTNLVFTATTTGAPILFSLDDTGSGRRFQNQAIHLDEARGTGREPGYLPFAKLIRANSVINVQLQNLDPGNAFNVRLGLWGFKVFTRMPEQEA
jgi:hypothetical protein